MHICFVCSQQNLSIAFILATFFHYSFPSRLSTRKQPSLSLATTMGKHATLVLAAISMTASAQLLAEFVPQALSGRSATSVGGWTLSQLKCPSGTSFCGSSWCCPNSLSCEHVGDHGIANICCPGSKLQFLLGKPAT